MKHFPLPAVLLVATLSLQIARSHDFAAPRQETIGMLADTLAFFYNMARLYASAAWFLAAVAMALSFLPRKWRVLRWLGVIPALGSILIAAVAFREGAHHSLPWLILAAPVVLALFAVWRMVRKSPSPVPVGVDVRTTGSSASESQSQRCDGPCHY